MVSIQREIREDIYTEYLQQKHSSVKSGKGKFRSETSITRNSPLTYLTFQIYCLQFSASHLIKLKTLSTSLVPNMSGSQLRRVYSWFGSQLSPQASKCLWKVSLLGFPYFIFNRKRMKQTIWISFVKSFDENVYKHLTL